MYHMIINTARTGKQGANRDSNISRCLYLCSDDMYSHYYTGEYHLFMCHFLSSPTMHLLENSSYVCPVVNIVFSLVSLLSL